MIRESCIGETDPHEFLDSPTFENVVAQFRVSSSCPITTPKRLARALWATLRLRLHEACGSYGLAGNVKSRFLH